MVTPQLTLMLHAPFPICRYNSRSLGAIHVKIVGIDSRGAFDGGVTYLIESPQLDGVIETVRDRLSRVKPLGP